MQRAMSRLLIAAAGSALVIAACGGGTVAPAAPAASAAGAAAKPFQGTKQFNVVNTAVGVSTVPLLAALDTLRAQGFTIQAPEVGESATTRQLPARPGPTLTTLKAPGFATPAAPGPSRTRLRCR